MNSKRSRLVRIVSLLVSFSLNSAIAHDIHANTIFLGSQFDSQPNASHSFDQQGKRQTENLILAAKTYPTDIPETTSSPKNDGGNNNWILPAVIVGAIAFAAINNAMSDEPSEESDDVSESETQELTRQLKTNGPRFSGLYNMSAFMIMGLVQGGWPIVIEFEQQQAGYVELMLRTRTSETFRYRLDGAEPGRRHIVLPLPPGIGSDPVPALIAVTATASKQSDQTLSGFQLIGLGAGPRAVGSVAIDKVTIATNRIRSSLGQTASYSFYAHSDFENAVVDFMKVDEGSDGQRIDWVNAQELAGGVTADQKVGEQGRLAWDGRNPQQDISIGAHKLQVRVWHNKGDWVSAWSDSAFFVTN